MGTKRTLQAKGFIMLNAREAEAAWQAIPRVKDTTKEEYLSLAVAYNEAVKKVAGEFRDWLAHEYAFTLPKTVQNKIWEKAWSEGHSAGYHEVENYYTQYAEFAAFAINAVM